jgi:hypothetical protein
VTADILETACSSQTFFTCKFLDILKLCDLNIAVQNVTIFIVNRFLAKKK